MKRNICVLSVFVALFAIATAVAAAALTSKQEIASRQYLIGTWNCSYTVGKEAGKYTTTWANVLDNRWLKQTYDQPAQATAAAFKAEYLVGFDEERQGWVRFGAMTTGQYFAIRMTDTPDDGWAWKYVGFFGSRRAESSDPDAKFTKKSNAEYMVDGPTYPANGVTVTEHHICRKNLSS